MRGSHCGHVLRHLNYREKFERSAAAKVTESVWKIDLLLQ